MSNTNDEEIPYRSTADLGSLVEDEKFTQDEDEQSTLRRVHKILADGVAQLDKWHAFDLTETELKLKQQIKAHQLAAGLLEPTLDAVTQALATIDENFRKRNNK